MHAQRPLIADDRALDLRQNQEACGRGHHKPEESDREKRRLRRRLVRKENAGAADETSDEHSDKVRRACGGRITEAQRQRRVRDGGTPMSRAEDERHPSKVGRLLWGFCVSVAFLWTLGATQSAARFRRGT